MESEDMESEDMGSEDMGSEPETFVLNVNSPGSCNFKGRQIYAAMLHSR